MTNKNMLVRPPSSRPLSKKSGPSARPSGPSARLSYPSAKLSGPPDRFLASSQAPWTLNQLGYPCLLQGFVPFGASCPSLPNLGVSNSMYKSVTDIHITLGQPRDSHSMPKTVSIENHRVAKKHVFLGAFNHFNCFRIRC